MTQWESVPVVTSPLGPAHTHTSLHFKHPQMTCKEPLPCNLFKPELNAEGLEESYSKQFQGMFGRGKNKPLRATILNLLLYSGSTCAANGFPLCGRELCAQMISPKPGEGAPDL